MNNLFYKELKLAIHPTSIIFLALSGLILIPNYPYYLTFFYTALAVFFTCLSGRENNDIFYTMTLPIRKRDIVKSRFLHVILLQLVQVIIAVPFAFIRGTYNLPGNMVGMDANTAFFGLSFLMLGLFNYVFFNKYYKAPDKVGKSFMYGSITIAVFIVIAEAGAHISSFMKDVLDTKDPKFISYKIVVLIVGIVLYLFLTFISYLKSAKSFEALDL